MTLDEKEKIILTHYKSLIESQLFDEYDIIGFLIFIRPFVKEKLKSIYDFTNLIAHRKRDQGLLLDATSNASENKYEINNKKVVGYNGINYAKWKDEWIILGNKLNIDFSNDIIDELTLCIFSITQFTKYEIKRCKVEIELLSDENGYFYLISHEINKAVPYIVFMKLESETIKSNKLSNCFSKPVETVRINGKLNLKYEDGLII